MYEYDLILIPLYVYVNVHMKKFYFRQEYFDVEEAPLYDDNLLPIDELDILTDEQIEEKYYAS